MPRRLPRAVTVGYTVWMAVWVPCYWIANGPANFLWLCDFANFATAVGIWTANRRLLSSQLAGTLLIQSLWTVDFLAKLLVGAHLIGGTEYMFREESALFLRALSLFHLWTVPLLWFCLRRLGGYDPRGISLQVGFTAAFLPAGQWLGSVEQNLNWMWRPFGFDPPAWLPAPWLPLVGIPALLLLAYLPADRLLRRLLPETPSAG